MLEMLYDQDMVNVPPSRTAGVAEVSRRHGSYRVQLVKRQSRALVRRRVSALGIVPVAFLSSQAH
jgi:hypothetical protein